MNENKEESEKFIEFEKKLYKNMIEGMKIMLEIMREAAKPNVQDQKIIERAWSFHVLLNIKAEVLNEIGSSEKEIVSLTAKIFEKLPIEVKLLTIVEIGDKK